MCVGKLSIHNFFFSNFKYFAFYLSSIHNHQPSPSNNEDQTVLPILLQIVNAFKFIEIHFFPDFVVAVTKVFII